MPLRFQKQNGLGAQVGVWNIQENEQYFLEQLNLHPTEQVELNRIKGRRRLEWLSVRHLLHVMSGRSDRIVCQKDQYGKPYLQNSSLFISMSHSYQMSAAITADLPVGIDIQFRVDRIGGIAHKFITESERKLLPKWEITDMHLIWGAKECLYKAYGRRSLDFRKDILVEHIHSKGSDGEMTASIHKENLLLRYNLNYEWIDEDICLVTAIQLLDHDEIQSSRNH